jgi:hypothetical protein
MRPVTVLLPLSPCLALAPVVLGASVTSERLSRRKLHALASIRDRFPPASARCEEREGSVREMIPHPQGVHGHITDGVDRFPVLWARFARQDRELLGHSHWTSSQARSGLNVQPRRRSPSDVTNKQII